MTANQKAQAIIFFQNRILKADSQAFEDLFTEIMNYKEPDFTSIKPWGNIGDRKNDGFIPSRGIFYQVYAPEDIRKSYPAVVKKIKTDFTGLIKQWSGVKKFYFVVNDKYNGVNADSVQLLTQIKEDNNLDESKFITAKDLENILFSLSDYQIKKITGVLSLDNPILTPAILENSYLKKFSTISLLTNTQKSIDIDKIFVNLAIIKEKKEEKNNEKFINREVILSSYEEIYKPKEPIEIKELVEKSNKSLIYGKAGIGKTTLCKHIAYMWAKGELYNEFEYLIYIPLREWKSDSGIKGAIRDYYYSLDIKDISIDFDANKTLFLFDGYDELDADKKKILRDEIEKYTLFHYIITSRPHNYGENDFNDLTLYEIKGFNDNGIDSFVDNFFDNIEKQRAIKEFLHQNSNIKNICVVPLLLNMICTLWQQDSDLDKNITTTEIYSKIIDNILITHEDENVYFRENRRRIKNILGKLSFESLKNNQVIFSGDLVEELFNYDEMQFFRKGVVPAGFIKAISENRDILDNDLEFAHLTFQEYFTAYYLKNKRMKPLNIRKIFAHQLRFYQKYENMIIYLTNMKSDIQEMLFNDFVEFDPFIFREHPSLSFSQQDKLLKSILETLDKKQFMAWDRTYYFTNTTLVKFDKNVIDNNIDLLKEILIRYENKRKMIVIYILKLLQNSHTQKLENLVFDEVFIKTLSNKAELRELISYSCNMKYDYNIRLFSFMKENELIDVFLSGYTYNCGLESHLFLVLVKNGFPFSNVINLLDYFEIRNIDLSFFDIKEWFDSLYKIELKNINLGFAIDNILKQNIKYIILFLLHHYSNIDEIFEKLVIFSKRYSLNQDKYNILPLPKFSTISDKFSDYYFSDKVQDISEVIDFLNFYDIEEKDITDVMEKYPIKEYLLSHPR